jgi:lipid-A-disaccharide synthase
MSKKKIYIIAGEASGDLHGSNLVKALLKESKDLEIRFWGGDKMADLLGQPVKHIKELAFMGFVEVLMNLKTILENIKMCKSDIEHFQPDALVLIDYPGFNLRIAEWAKSKNIAVHYYISPQIWAWKENRVHKIKKCVDHMYTILPFETDFYKKHDFKVNYVGHPLLDEVLSYNQTTFSKERILIENKLGSKPIIALLPGSRKQEIGVKLPIMLDAVKGMDDYQFVIAGAPSLDEDFYTQFLSNIDVKIIFGQTYDLLNISTAALVTSGTATLETALFNIPEVVCYKGSKISYHIAKRLIKIKYISLVNLILDREVVTELIQDDCNANKIREELMKILPGGTKRNQMLSDYLKLKNVLGEGGASQKVAQSLLKTI